MNFLREPIQIPEPDKEFSMDGLKFMVWELEGTGVEREEQNIWELVSPHRAFSCIKCRGVDDFHTYLLVPTPVFPQRFP